MPSLQEPSSSLDASEKIVMMMRHFSTIQNISNKYDRIKSLSTPSPVQTQALEMMTKLAAETERKRNNVINSWVADAMREASAGGLTPAKKSESTTTQNHRPPPRTVLGVRLAEDAAREETLTREITPTKSILSTSMNSEQLEVDKCAAVDTVRKEFKSSRERIEEETLAGIITHTKRIRSTSEQRMFIDRCLAAYGKGESLDQTALTETAQSSLGKIKEQENMVADDDTVISRACDSSDISGITCPTFDGNTTTTSSTISDSTEKEPRPLKQVGFRFNIQQRQKALIDKMSKLSIISKSSQTLGEGQPTSKDTSTNAIVPTPLDPGNKRRTTCLERRRRSSLSHASSLVTATTTSTELTAASSLCLIDEEINETCVLMLQTQYIRIRG